MTEQSTPYIVTSTPEPSPRTIEADVADVFARLVAAIDAAHARIDALERRPVTQRRTWYSLEQAAEYLSVSTTTLYDLRASGRLRTHRVNSKPTFHVDDLDSLAVPDTELAAAS